MNKLKTIAFFLCTTIFFVSSCSTSKKNLGNRSKEYSPVAKDLYDTIRHLDSVFFGAFNERNLEEIKPFVSETLEFYHDLGGVTDYNQNIQAFKKNFDSDRRVRRELIVSSLEVYPIKDYGAVETGIHRFFVTEKGQQEKLSSQAKFVHIWNKKNGEWQIIRIISYGHEEYLK